MFEESMRPLLQLSVDSAHEQTLLEHIKIFLKCGLIRLNIDDLLAVTKSLLVMSDHPET